MNVDLALRGRLSSFSYALYKAALGCGDKIALTPTLLASASSGQFEWLMEVLNLGEKKTYNPTEFINTKQTRKDAAAHDDNISKVLTDEFYQELAAPTTDVGLAKTVHAWTTDENNVYDYPVFNSKFFNIVLRQCISNDNHVLMWELTCNYEIALWARGEMNSVLMNDILACDHTHLHVMYGIEEYQWIIKICASKHAIEFLEIIMECTRARYILECVVYTIAALKFGNISILKWVDNNNIVGSYRSQVRRRRSGLWWSAVCAHILTLTKNKKVQHYITKALSRIAISLE